MRFFEPSSRFLDWLAKYAAGRIVIDVGCGEGHIVRALGERGVKALGIDPMWEQTPDNVDLINRIIPLQAENVTCLGMKNALVLFCRPCHSGFVEAAINRVHHTSEVLYISKPTNVVMDLGDYRGRELKTPRCKEEKVYQVQFVLAEAL